MCMCLHWFHVHVLSCIPMFSTAIRCKRLPHSLTDAADQMLDRICDEHGAGAVGLVFTTLLCLAQTHVGGCSEEELQVCVRVHS